VTDAYAVVVAHAQKVTDFAQLLGIVAVCRVSVMYDKQSVLFQIQGASDLAIELRAVQVLLIGLGVVVRYGPPPKGVAVRKVQPTLARIRGSRVLISVPCAHAYSALLLAR
jgi:uncharacterized protein (UPF0218 family)